ncbi:preprotein translocase subunit SecE [Candidatus Gottesmanbacteria bacterium]|nr:preprotein translocase subunit SecE [Candidatus Gottesmanbacteria bacterium]
MFPQVKPVVFLKEVKAELSKVVWPTRKETVRLTLVVIGVSLAVGIFLGGIDFILTRIMEVVLRR